jgi:AraC-like DNA-binding protein
MAAIPPAVVTRHCSALGEWTTVRRDPNPHLRAYVRSYEGYAETRPLVAARMEAPSVNAVMIINLGTPYRVTGPGNRAADRSYGSFAAGLIDAHVFVQATGLSAGLQVNFTPLGAGLFFGLSMRELTNRTVALADIFGPEAERLEARLDDTPDWHARFDVLDAFIARRLAAAPAPPRAVDVALARLTSTGGAASVQSLADTAGWSRKHLAAQFRDYVGLSPKTMARVIRFNRAQSLLRDGWDGRWIDLALACGYYDQAHFNRDFRDFTGEAPSAFARRLLPDGGVLG